MIYEDNRVFLGGTVNGVNPLYGWRGVLIPMFNGKCDFFNPVVTTYTNEAKKEEERQKNEVCNYNLFVITPDMRGVWSITEAVDLSNKKPDGVIFCVLNTTYVNDKKFSKAQKWSLNETGKRIEQNGGHYFKTLKEVADFLTI